MVDFFNKLSEQHKGIVLMVMGAILLVHTLGIVELYLNIIIIGAALYMFVCGFIKSGAYNQLLLLLKRYRAPKS